LTGIVFLNYLLSEEELAIEGEEKIVTKITDGDTIIVQGGKRVRLLGIDCDERGKKCYQAAKEFNEKVLLNQEVVLIGNEEDIYGRDLRYIFLNGSNFNKRLVEEGYCVARFDQESEYEG